MRSQPNYSYVVVFAVIVNVAFVIVFVLHVNLTLLEATIEFVWAPRLQGQFLLQSTGHSFGPRP